MTLERTAAETIRVLKECTSNKEINLAIDQITESIIKTDEVGKLITIFGNGGSAADAQHWSGELVCTYSNPVRKSYRSIALTTDSSVLTAWPNDFEFETVFERQIISMGNIIGLAIGLSTSGESKNVIKALKKAKDYGSQTCLITGNNKTKYDYIDYLIKIPSSETAIIQTITQVIYHSICQKLEP